VTAVPDDPPRSPGPGPTTPPPTAGTPPPAGTTTPTTGTTTTPKTPYEPPAWTRVDPESQEFKQGMRAERERREKKYQGAPESRFP